MERIVELMRTLHRTTASLHSREISLATLSEAIDLWRNHASLVAYEVVLAALNSNNDEVRDAAAKFLNRNSPRPRSGGKGVPHA